MEAIREDIDYLGVGLYGNPPPRVSGTYALERYENLDGWLSAMGIRYILCKHTLWYVRRYRNCVTNFNPHECQQRERLRGGV